MAGVKEKLRMLLDLFVRGVQLVFITTCLTLIYVLVMGMMYIYALIFRRQILGTRADDSTTYWTDAEASQPGLDDCQRQS